MKQTPKTIKFISGVKSLIESGVVKNHTEIIKALEWEKTMYSNVLNGRRNVPNDKYLLFTQVYQTEDTNTETFAIQKLIRVDAMCEVIISAIAEMLAIQKGKSATGIINDLQVTVNSKIKQMLDKSI